MAIENDNDIEIELTSKISALRAFSILVRDFSNSYNDDFIREAVALRLGGQHDLKRRLEQETLSSGAIKHDVLSIHNHLSVCIEKVQTMPISPTKIDWVRNTYAIIFEDTSMEAINHYLAYVNDLETVHHEHAYGAAGVKIGLIVFALAATVAIVTAPFLGVVTGTFGLVTLGVVCGSAFLLACIGVITAAHGQSVKNKYPEQSPSLYPDSSFFAQKRFTDVGPLGNEGVDRFDNSIKRYYAHPNRKEELLLNACVREHEEELEPFFGSGHSL